jgi:hypothetical protein
MRVWLVTRSLKSLKEGIADHAPLEHYHRVAAASVATRPNTTESNMRLYR